MKENIADDLALGYSFADIADRYGVSYSTIRRVKNNSPETVSTPIEPVPEETNVDNIDTSIVPETAEKVKPEPDCDGQQRTEMDCGGQTEQPNNSRQLDYEEQREYIADILKATLEDIDEEIRAFEERIWIQQKYLEEQRLKQAYLRDFIKSMR
jgi:transcriptional regulator with XRE-family HTH domain